jgi:hypothetical protein
VKIRHRVSVPWDYVPPSHVETDDRYLAELDAARAKAEKAWKSAQAALARAEKRLEAKPDPDLKAARETALAEFEARETELAELQRLMQAPTAGPKRVVHRAGKQDRLETGKSQRRRR